MPAKNERGPFVWEVAANGRMAIIQYGKHFHLLTAAETFDTFTDCVRGMFTLEKKQSGEIKPPQPSDAAPPTTPAQEE